MSFLTLYLLCRALHDFFTLNNYRYCCFNIFHIVPWSYLMGSFSLVTGIMYFTGKFAAIRHLIFMMLGGIWYWANPSWEKKHFIKIFVHTLLTCFKFHTWSNFLHTVFSRIEAAASICFLYFLVRFLFEGGFYLPQFSVGNSSDGTV